MPFYSYRCPAGHCEDVFLSVQARNHPRKCKVCAKKVTRLFSSFGVHGEHHAHQLYSFEQKYWEEATGQKFDNAGQLNTWCKENGKAVVDPSTYRTPKPEAFSEREAIKSLDKIYETNHSLGTVKTKGKK